MKVATMKFSQDKSRRCRFCSGDGYMTVEHREYRGHRIEDIEWEDEGETIHRRVAMVVLAHCICPKGRWMRSKQDAETLEGIPDLVDVLSGDSVWRLSEAPRQWMGASKPWREMVADVVEHGKVHQ